MKDYFQSSMASLLSSRVLLLPMPGYHHHAWKGRFSDYTAAIYGNLLNCKSIEIWTDVSGMMTADPRLVSNASVIPDISYQEAMELSHFGAKVIYPPTLQPVMNKDIPVSGSRILLPRPIRAR